MVYYRAGRYKEAIETLEKSLPQQPDAAGFDLFFLAMSHQHLGNAARARDCYDQAVRWFQEKKATLRPEWIEELTQFQAEAAAVLKSAPRTQ